MKISSVAAFQVAYALQDTEYAWSGGHSVSSFDTTIVEIVTDDGLRGYGEVCPLGSGYMEAYARGVPSGIAELGPALIGQDPTRIRQINAMMDNLLGGHAYVKSPIDMALWDILGKASGLSCATLLGGRTMETYPLYRAISQREPGLMASDVEKYQSEGYTRFQLKVGADPDEDIARVRAVLRIIRPGDVLVADANTGWLQHQAVRVVQSLASDNVYIEAPCSTYEECLAIRRQTDLPFVLDEVITGIGPFLRAYADGAMDVINIKISRVGGLTKAIQLRNLCEQLGIAMTLEDSWGGDVTTAAIAALVGSTRPEHLFTSTDFNSYIDTSIASDAPRRVDGRLRVPSGPGLGISVDRKTLGDPAVMIGG
jgi:L-alanine-DL-glutamate epimerase-like enolase superfamily enzyme